MLPGCLSKETNGVICSTHYAILPMHLNFQIEVAISAFKWNTLERLLEEASFYFIRKRDYSAEYRARERKRREHEKV
jgi:hypothetical protein